LGKRERENGVRTRSNPNITPL